MYPAFDWSAVLQAIMDISACELITGQASTGPFGSPVFACAGTSISSHPLADLGGQVIQLLANNHAAA
jgi:hypothetical protein